MGRQRQAELFEAEPVQPSDLEVVLECRRTARDQVDAMVRGRPLPRRQHVLDLRPDRPHRLRLIGGIEVVVRLEQRREALRMARLRVDQGLAVLAQPVGRELLDERMEAVATFVDATEQALVVQRREHRQRDIGDRERGFARASAAKHREPSQRALLCGRQQSPGMLETRPQAALANGWIAQRLVEELEGAPQVGSDLVDRQDPHPGRRELDRQRHAFDRAHDVLDSVEVALEPERRLNGTRAQLEQADGVVRVQRGRLGLVGIGHRQALERQQPLAGDRGPDARGEQHAQFGQGLQQARDPRAEAREMLAVVEHEQRATASEALRDRGRRVAAVSLEPQPRRDPRCDLQQLRDIFQRDPEDAVGKPVPEALDRGESDPALADPARAGDGQQSALAVAEQALELAQLALAAENDDRRVGSEGSGGNAPVPCVARSACSRRRADGSTPNSSSSRATKR